MKIKGRDAVKPRFVHWLGGKNVTPACGAWAFCAGVRTDIEYPSMRGVRIGCQSCLGILRKNAVHYATYLRMLRDRSPRYNFEVWSVDDNGEFLRMSGHDYTEKKAFIECGNWKNATHFRLVLDDGSIWKEWGLSRPQRKAIIGAKQDRIQS